jgi:hypothetical protein
MFLNILTLLLFLINDLDFLCSKILHLLVFSVKILEDKMKRDSMVDCNDKFIKNKSNIGECMIFECREFKSLKML